MSRLFAVLPVALIVLLLTLLLSTYGCNEAVCGTIVSKCMLTQSCKCDLSNCSCCHECFFCLAHLYDECCSCVDLCPGPSSLANGSDGYGPRSNKSLVADLDIGVPTLFKALTDDPDPQERWHAFNYTMNLASKLLSSVEPVNCTVAYLAECRAWDSCEKSCRSMGATSYRWFHDGCCECVGHNCIDYGINRSMCLKCPIEETVGEDEFFDDYGQFEDEDDAFFEDRYLGPAKSVMLSGKQTENAATVSYEDLLITTIDGFKELTDSPIVLATEQSIRLNGSHENNNL